MTKYVVGFMFDRKEFGVLLIKKNKPAWQKGLLNGIGGKIEVGENGLEAMRREFKEEVGILNEDWRYVVTMSGEDWSVQVYTASTDDVHYFKQMEAEEPLYILFEELNDFDNVSNLLWLIEMCRDKNGGNGINYVVTNRPESPSTDEGREAKEFAEWAAGNLWRYDTGYEKWSNEEHFTLKTTDELYTEFKSKQ